MWTYTWLDNQVRGLKLPLGSGGLTESIGIEVGADPTPPAIKQGQRIFNDAHFSKHNDFSCNNCHIDGLMDGLVWDLLVDGQVNTLAFRNVAGTNPFLWGGQLPTLFDFSREVLKLVGAEASGEQMEMLTLYMQSVTAPPNPYALPGGKLSEQAKLGKEVFEAPAGPPGGGGCGGCHSGPLYTNQSSVKGKTEGMMTDVPALIGVYDTAPYGRQGQWRSLKAMIDYALEFTGADVSADEAQALLQYTREIPGDALYLNSARPLNKSDHNSFETPIELTFSQLLAPDQEDLLSFQGVLDGELVAIDGTWSLSGRIARFVPDEPLALESSYQITVSAGLSGTLGQVLYEPMKLTWSTGGVPAFDCSGTWSTQIILTDPISFQDSITAAFLQSEGGKITGVLLDGIGGATLDHMAGVMSLDTMVLKPFLIDSPLGELMVDSFEVTMADTDDDGYADTGTGTAKAIGFSSEIKMVRTSGPSE